MKCQPDQLAASLKNSLAPIYFIYGEEILLRNEAANTIWQRAQKLGHTSKTRLIVQGNFDWIYLRNTTRTRSLFEDAYYIELNGFNGKPGINGAKILQEYAKAPAPDTILVLIANKLEKTVLQTSWFKAIDQTGIIIHVDLIKPHQYSKWVQQRLKIHNLTTTPQGIQFIVERNVGNLITCAQEIEKLSLIYGHGNITETEIAAAITDNAQFTLFELMDAALARNVPHMLHILNHLRQSQTEPILLLWVIARQLRELIEVSSGRKSAYKNFAQKQILLQQATQDKKLPYWLEVLSKASELDRTIKGYGSGECWHEIAVLCLKIARVTLF